MDASMLSHPSEFTEPVGDIIDHSGYENIAPTPPSSLESNADLDSSLESIADLDNVLEPLQTSDYRRESGLPSAVSAPYEPQLFDLPKPTANDLPSQKAPEPGDSVPRSGIITTAHKGFVGGMIHFFGSWWGVLTITIIVIGLLIIMSSLLGDVDHSTQPPTATAPHPADAPHPAQFHPHPTSEPTPSLGEVTIFLAWEANREPTREDKIIIFNVGSPNIAWSCCASSIFKLHKEVHVRLPPGNYAARTVHKNGLQQVCSLETSRRVAITDAASKCSDASEATDSKQIYLEVCETIIE